MLTQIQQLVYLIAYQQIKHLLIHLLVPAYKDALNS